MLNSGMLRFVKVTNDDLINFLSKAKRRIIFAKPAFTKQEIDTLLEVIHRNKIICNLYIEAGDGAIRHGFGEAESLELISENIDEINIQTVERIRMAILIVDDDALFYSPDLSFMEEEDKSLSFPNGFFGDRMISESIINEFNKTDKGRNKVIPFPNCDIPKDEGKDVKGEIVKSIESLKKDPAIDPGKLRKISFYRSNYKIIKIQVMGVKLENKKISLRPFLSMVSDYNEKDIRSWGIFGNEDIEKLQDTKEFKNELKKITDKYLLNTGRFGHIIDVQQKSDFMDEVEKIKKDFTSYLNGDAKDSDNNTFTKIKKEKEKAKKENKGKTANSSSTDYEVNIKIILNKSRGELLSELMKISKEDQEFAQKACLKDRLLGYDLDNKTPQDEAIIHFIDRFIINDLKFPTESEIISNVDVKIDIYDISDELLYDNEDFEKIIEDYKNNSKDKEGLKFRSYEEGYKKNN